MVSAGKMPRPSGARTTPALGDVDLPLGGPEEPGRRLASRGLSSPVGTEEGDDLAGVDGEVHAVEDGGTVVSGVDVT